MGAERSSSAATKFVQRVSPPWFGTANPRKIEAIAGFATNVMSVCQPARVTARRRERRALGPVTEEDPLLAGVHRVNLWPSLERRLDRMRRRDLAEVLPEADVVVLRDRLVSEEQHLPLQERVAERTDGARIEWLAEIDAIDMRADDARRRLDRQG